MKTNITVESDSQYGTTYHWTVTGDYNSSSWSESGDTSTREEAQAAIAAAVEAREVALTRSDLYSDVAEPVRSAIISALSALTDRTPWEDIAGYDEEASSRAKGRRFVAAGVVYTRDDTTLPYYAESVIGDELRFYYEDAPSIDWINPAA